MYTCRAGNDVGVRDLNFTLTVNSDDSGGGNGMTLQAVVIEAGPENGTDVRAGDTAVMKQVSLHWRNNTLLKISEHRKKLFVKL